MGRDPRGAGLVEQVLVDYVWRRPDVRPVFPQIVIIERSTKTTDAGIEFGPDRLVAVLAGTEGIQAWLAGGGELPASQLLSRK